MITSFQDFWSNTNYRIASFIAVAMVLWFATGIFASDAPPIQPPPEKTGLAELNSVRAKTIEAESFPLVVSLKGQTEANRAVDVRAEVGGQVESLKVNKGAVVNKGQVLCQIAVEDRALRVSEAQAAVDQAQIEYDGALRLKTGGFQSETAIASAKSKLESSKANLLRRQIDLEKTAIRAPFAGVVEERPVEIGDLVRAGDTCATVIDLDPLLLTARVSEQEVANVPKSGVVNARLITGQNVEGEIRYVSRRSDDVTRTFRIEAEIENPNQNLVSGITAEMKVLMREVPAHLISASLLILDDEGELGVKILDHNNRVQLRSVELVGDDKNGIWVTGLPATTKLITVGHEYVGLGETVNVTLVDQNVSNSSSETLPASQGRLNNDSAIEANNSGVQ